MPRHIFVGSIFLMALKGLKLDIILNKFKSELGNWSESIQKSGCHISECICLNIWRDILKYVNL